MPLLCGNSVIVPAQEVEAVDLANNELGPPGAATGRIVKMSTETAGQIQRVDRLRLPLYIFKLNIDTGSI